jgi:hypothetical protein
MVLRCHRTTKSNLKCDAITIALSKTFKRWMINEDAIAKREKRRRQKETTYAQFFNLTKTIKTKESLAKPKTKSDTLHAEL